MNEQPFGIFSKMAADFSSLITAGQAYAVDAAQRAVLYADVRRQRGDQYRTHLAEAVPNVLNFPSELVLDGRELERPVNYGLVRITPAPDHPVQAGKRPFVVIDPRAGHGPGIAGFKADSEIGAALEAGHPCYFVGFTPNPEPGQTVEDVMLAEAAFLEKVIALHPDCEKPAVIGNCQAGWQVLMTAAMRPDLFGPIIVAGAPVSYWAGWRGKNPMRYAGGMLGGSWLTALASDLGDGRFDGASLVQNFENLDPANTFWKKSYNLYANIDTEASRYLGFEKYWGGHVLLNGAEIQYIVDNLFIGNKLSTSSLVTSNGIRIDLRNIRSPIVVFCSNGDNITPPPQALGWVTDLYQNESDVLSHDQTIIYALHDSIGHLGIFVSGAVGRKEHKKFATNIELINLIPSGLYQAVIQDGAQQADGQSDQFVMAIERRTLDDVRAIVAPAPESDRRFAAVDRISQINLSLYRDFAQRWVRGVTTSQSADALRRLHPLRISYEFWSSRSPMAQLVKKAAADIRAHRSPAAPDNLFLKMQESFSEAIVTSLNTWRDIRDTACEQWFEWVYSSPVTTALAGLDAHRGEPVRPFPGVSPEHKAFVREQLADLRTEIEQGGLLEAGIRALVYVGQDHLQVDERQFNLAIELAPAVRDYAPDVFRKVIRRQAALMQLDFQAAVEAIPRLLGRAAEGDIRNAAKVIALIERLGPSPSGKSHSRLLEMLQVFEAAAVTASH
ncbi:MULTISPECIES: DUF3141 domain-containing protein [unclassified Xanthobacter]|uniref:DUF3141 domain-containing protein n=1 Tax=unclassified Xanthobacter TaxID=2623496 RepID=UPI001F379334|nr:MULTISPECIES: DUF3141 domain-containing protein [unclassified Xanthobacter]